MIVIFNLYNPCNFHPSKNSTNFVNMCRPPKLCCRVQGSTQEKCSTRAYSFLLNIQAKPRGVVISWNNPLLETWNSSFGKTSPSLLLISTVRRQICDVLSQTHSEILFSAYIPQLTKMKTIAWKCSPISGVLWKVDLYQNRV